MEDFLNFCALVLGVNNKEITEGTSYGSIEQWDSLMHIRLVAEIEENYHIDIPMSDIVKIRTLKDFYNYIRKWFFEKTSHIKC